MKFFHSDKGLMTDVAKNSSVLYILTDEERISLRQVLLDMYDDLIQICQRDGLTLMLSGGSCLGAVRHKGFIPWDDDLDLMMPRQDYNKLLELLQQGALDSKKYEYTYPSNQSDSPTHFLKIYRRNSLDVEITIANSPFPKGIFIDIFPLEGVPQNKLIKNFKGIMSFLLRGIGTCVAYFKFSGSAFDSFSELNPSLKKKVQIKKKLGHFMSIIPHRLWLRLFENVVKKPCSEDKEVTIPAGRNHYAGEIHPYCVFFPPKESEFEGRKVYVPRDCDKYLTALYGNDYMQLPPLENRERHFVYKFSLPNNQ